MSLYAFYQYQPSIEVSRYVSAGEYDRIFPHYIGTIMPAGIRGLTIAALMAAAMSTMDSVLNALATISVVNIYKKIKPNVSDGTSLKMAKLLTVFWGIIVTFLAWLMIDIVSILKTIQSIAGIIMGPILGIFILGMFTKRSNWQGTLIGLIASFLPLLFIKFGAKIMTSIYGILALEGPIPDWIGYLSSMTFTLYGFIGVILCVVVGYFASWAFRAPDTKRIFSLIWKPHHWKDMLFGNPEKTIDISMFLEQKKES
jgi:SSS family solute:Na+ symporter